MTPEQEILDIIRELKPFEVIEIYKDKSGKPNRYILTRSQIIEIKPE